MKFLLAHLSVWAFVSSVLSIAAFGQGGCRPTPAAAEVMRPTTPEEAVVDSTLRKALDAAQHGRPLDAKQLYLVALESAEKLPDTSPEKRRAMMMASNAYMRDQNSEQSIALAKRVLDMDEKALGPQDPQIALDLDQLAMRYNSGNPVEAARSFDRAVKLAEATTDMDCFWQVMLFSNAANFYMAQKRYPDAEAVLRRAVDSAADIPSTKGPVLQGVRTMLASVLRSEGKDEEAEQLMSAPVPMPPPVQNARANPDLTGPLSDLDRVRQYAEQGRQQDAEMFYRRAISALEGAPPRLALGSLSLALDQLGEICHTEGRNSEAEDLFLRALDLREKNAGPQVIAVVRMLGSPAALQNFYRGRGRLSDMEPVYQRAIQIQEEYLDPHDEALSSTFFNAAQLYGEEGKSEQSLPMYEKALHVREQSVGRNDAGLLPILRSYASALRNLGRKDEAKRLEARARSIERAKASANR